MPASPSLAELRQLLAARFPTQSRRVESVVPVGVPALDEALSGGLPTGAFTELVSTPTAGGGVVLDALIRTTRKARQRLAILDAADCFSPEEQAPELLEHLVWTRCNGQDLSSFWAVADLLLRDSHFTAAVLDLRGVPERPLLRTPGTTWYRLLRALEQSSVSALVLSSTAVVPCARHRFSLRSTLSVGSFHSLRVDLAASLSPQHERVRGALHHSA